MKARFADDERVTKATKSVAKANAAARQFQAEAYDRFEARMERMRDLLGVKQMSERTSKIASKIEKLEDEVAETVAKSKDRLSKVDLKARIARLSAEIEAVAGETGADIAKTAKKAADKTSKAMKAAVAAPEASDDLSQITGVGPAMGAEKASRAKSSFLASISHELRTPLNAIIGFSEIIEQELLGPVGTPEYRQYADDILNSGRHLLKIINDVLDLSKSETGALSFDLAPVEIGQVVEACRRRTSG